MKVLDTPEDKVNPLHLLYFLFCLCLCLSVYMHTKMLPCLLCVIISTRYGHFSGINRKVQLTYLRNGQPKASSEEEGTDIQTEIVFVIV